VLSAKGASLLSERLNGRGADPGKELCCMGAEDDAIVAEIALERGWIKPNTLRRALEIQSAALALDLDERLLDILRTKGFISDRDAGALDEELGLDRLVLEEHRGDIEGYLILAKMGRSGLGAIFRAGQLSMERTVALKVLPPELAKNPDFVGRFQKEAEAVGRIGHPNVVGALDAGRCGDYSYYAMEFVEGENLRETLRAGPLAIPKVLDIAAQMAEALAHLDALGLVHRDIRPGNIILMADGTAKLLNVGVARDPEDPCVAEAGIPVGTPHYVSPELAAGSKHIDIRSDLYSLGATLFHLASGQYPFKAGSRASLLVKHMHERLRPPIELRPEMPRALSDLLCQIMAKEPGERVRSPFELGRAIGAIQAELAPSVQRDEAVAARPLPEIAPPAEPTPASVKSDEARARPIIAPPPEPGPGPADADSSAALPSIAPPMLPKAPVAVRRPRTIARMAWAAAIATLIALLARSIVWAVRTRLRGRPASPRPEVSGQAHPSTETPVRQPAEEIARGPQRTPAEDAARRLAQAAIAFDDEHPFEHRAALLGLRRALLATRTQPLASQLEARLQARRLALTGAANRAYGDLVARVRALREHDKFGEALRACASFPSELRYGVWAERVDAQAAALGAQAEQRYLELATNGALALRQARLKDALGAYERVGALGIPWLERVGAALLAPARQHAESEQRRLDEVAKRRALLERRLAFGQLTGLFASASEEIKRRQYGKALGILKAAPEALRQGDLGKAIERLESTTRLLLDLWNRVREGPPAAVGEPFHHGVKGVITGFTGLPESRQVVFRFLAGASQRTLRLPILRLPPAELAKLAEWATAGEPPASAAHKLGLFYLSEGKSKEALGKLQQAAKLGADVAADLEALKAQATVAQGRAAHKEGQWAKARAALEAALDHYAAHPPVILDHPRLMAALKACLRKLGEPTSVAPARPPPLPASLRRLPVLPETRLGAAPRNGSLAPYFGTPLERASPIVLGLSRWSDYTLTLRWTVTRGRGLVALVRLSETRPGHFAYYYVAVDADRVVLGRRLPDRSDELASGRFPDLLKRRPHRLTLSLTGPSLVASFDKKHRLEAVDNTLSRGNLGIATAGGEVVVHELSVLLPAARQRGGTSRRPRGSRQPSERRRPRRPPAP